MLKVIGTAADDKIVVRFKRGDPSKIQVVVNGKPQEEEYDRSKLRVVTIEGKRGDDLLRNNTDLPSSMGGGPGNDSLFGGKSSDDMEGGKGHDLLIGGAGRDTLEGGPGEDHLEGGRGMDTLRGGNGDDELFGDDGDDRMRGGDGDDELTGGDGRDVMHGQKGDGTLRVGRDGATDKAITGGPGFDRAIGANPEEREDSFGLERGVR